jgi:antitoxin component YwqK of YwqJK toxin-antitoxin module
MKIECPHCGQHIELEGSEVTEFSCPTCNGQIQLQVKAEAIKPPAAVSASLGQGIKMPVLLGPVAGAVVLSLLVGWLIWGRSSRKPADSHPGIELKVSEPTVVVDVGNSPDKKPSQGEQKDESAEKWAEREWVIKNLNYIRYHAIDRSKIQVRGEDQLAYVVNSVTPYTGWVTEERYSGVFAGKSLLRIQEGKMLLHAEFFITDQLESWKTYHPTLRCPHGLHIKWYENGNLSEHSNYRDGVLSGVSKRWYESGVQSFEVRFENDKENGLSIEWHENGNKRCEQHYKDGILDGKSVEYHENGQKHEEGQYKDGKMTGRWDFWHDTGAKSTVVNLQDGLKTGPVESWHPNGKLWSKGAYRNDQRVGDWVWWDQNGKVTRKDTYDQNGTSIKSWSTDPIDQPFESKPPQGALRE